MPATLNGKDLHFFPVSTAPQRRFHAKSASELGLIDLRLGGHTIALREVVSRRARRNHCAAFQEYAEQVDLTAIERNDGILSCPCEIILLLAENSIDQFIDFSLEQKTWLARYAQMDTDYIASSDLFLEKPELLKALLVPKARKRNIS